MSSALMDGSGVLVTGDHSQKCFTCRHPRFPAIGACKEFARGKLLQATRLHDSRSRGESLAYSRAQAVDCVMRGKHVVTDHCRRRESTSGVNQSANHTRVHEPAVRIFFRTPVHRKDDAARLRFKNFDAAPSIERRTCVQFAQRVVGEFCKNRRILPVKSPPCALARPLAAQIIIRRESISHIDKLSLVFRTS